MKNNSQSCPCESGKSYKHCCQPIIEQHNDAITAEALMRSRYTAFVLLNETYLRYSWHPDTCPKDLNINTETKWLGLNIKNIEQGHNNDDCGHVEFVARFKINGKGYRLHENSQFIKYNSRWVYLNGKITE